MAEEFSLDHPCGLSIHRDIPESALHDVAGVTANDMGTGYVWYRLPEAEIAGQRVSMSLCFYKQELDSLSVADTNPEFGSSWEEWTEEKEKARAKATERWLAAVGYSVGEYPWGAVWAGTDVKTGDGRGVVRFHRP